MTRHYYHHEDSSTKVRLLGIVSLFHLNFCFFTIASPLLIEVSLFAFFILCVSYFFRLDDDDDVNDSRCVCCSETQKHIHTD